MKYSTRKKLDKLSNDISNSLCSSLSFIDKISEKINDKLKTVTNEKKAYKELKKVIQKKLLYYNELYLTDGYVNNDITVIDAINIEDLFSSYKSQYLSNYKYTMVHKLKIYTKEEFINKWIENINKICKEDNLKFKEISKDELFREYNRNDNNYSYTKIKRAFRIWVVESDD